ncbi:MAG: DUF5050 domain-containing protein [Bacillota bacterium]|nr:DUF5050 domain-containing protein [Bacillota bacterium]
MSMKRSINLTLFAMAVSALLLCSSFALFKSEAFAADDSQIKVAIDDRFLNFDVPPTIISGRTLVPLRVIFEELGASVSWDQKTKTVTGQKQGRTVKLTINNQNAYVNGKLIKIDVPPKIINGRTLVPTRFIAESLGTDVYWKAKEKIVSIIPPKVIKFTDANLEAGIRKALKKSTGSSITTTDVKNIKSLNLENQKISNIEGLQYFKALTELKLNQNDIKDITYLGSLTNLSSLEIKKNEVKDISPLKNLTKLTTALLAENQIRDLSPLRELTGITALDLCANQIFDISSLSKLSKLQYLYLLSNPLTDISVIKGFKNIKKLYIMDFDNPEKINQQLFDKYEKLDKKVKDIIANVVKPGMTEMDKELILHDYVVTHVKYDRLNFIKDTLPPQRHCAYGALIENIAVCDGYATALQILLNAAGIECYTVIGDADFLNGALATTRSNGTKWKHAWNIVKINDVYYQVDATANDPVYEDGRSELTHKYFNLSDKQMGIEYSWDRGAFPACNNGSASYDMNIREKRNTIITENQYYFIDANKNIVKMSLDGKNKLKLGNDRAIQIAILGDWIYYINETDGNKVYKIKTDGSSKTKLSEGSTCDMETAGDNIYFIKDYKIYRMNQDGLNQTAVNSDAAAIWVDIIDDTMFYKAFNYGVGGRLVKSDPNGNNKSNISNDEPFGFKPRSDGGVNFWFVHNEHIMNDWVYYINNSDKKSVYKIKKDGTERTKLTSDSVTDATNADIEIVNNYIYYKNASDGNKYYRINLDGSNRQAME